MKYPAILHKDPDGLWIEFPDLDTCVTQGDNMEELIRNGEEALACYLETMLMDGDIIPEPSNLQGDNIIYINVSPETAVPIIFKKERERQGLNQREVAQRIGAKSHRSVQCVERKERSPSIKKLSRLARALGKKLVIELE